MSAGNAVAVGTAVDVGNAVRVVEGSVETELDRVESLAGAEGGIVGLQAATTAAPSIASLTARGIIEAPISRMASLRRVSARTWNAIAKVHECHRPDYVGSLKKYSGRVAGTAATGAPEPDGGQHHALAQCPGMSHDEI
jgi:hypothetical protein